MATTFWSNDLTVLINKELWPTQRMTFEEKMNSVSRLVILMTLLGFVFTRSIHLLIIGIITLASLFTLYKIRKSQFVSSEGFRNKIKTNNNNKTTTNPVTLDTVLRSDFHPTTKQNPFGNVLLTDISDSPNRKAAAPSFNPDVYDDINNSVKKQTQMLNPTIVNTNKQIYGDLYDNYQLDNAMMRFYSTANTRVDSDQGAFANWLYSDYPSGKEDGVAGAIARVRDNPRYILI
jgi:hypothetical protein